MCITWWTIRALVTTCGFAVAAPFRRWLPTHSRVFSESTELPLTPGFLDCTEVWSFDTNSAAPVTTC